MLDRAPIRILALCSSYNRSAVTLLALRSLHDQQLSADTKIQFAVVDDASTDGTQEAIRRTFPDVIVLNTRGDLYWAGGMRFGFLQLWNSSDYTHLLVFNDDGLFFPNAINALLEAAEHSGCGLLGDCVVVGALCDKVTRTLTYGGLKQRRWRPKVFLQAVPPTQEVQVVDTLNMNLALISRKTLTRNGFLDDGFTHSGADYDFGFRASRNGTNIFLARGFLGECCRNSIAGTWEDVQLSFFRRWLLIRQPKGLPFGPRYKYLRLHAPYIWIPIWAWPYAKLFVSHPLHRIQLIITNTIGRGIIRLLGK